MSESTPRADEYEYLTLRSKSHTDLTDALNEAAEFCWEPSHYAIWSAGEGYGTDLIEKGVHFVILRRDTAYFQSRIVEVAEALSAGDYADDPDQREWAERFLERAREDGYDAE